MEELEKEILKAGVNNLVIVQKGAVNIQRVEHFHQAKDMPEDVASEKEELTDENLRNKINSVLPKITSNRLWFCIIKVLMLHGLVAYDDFEDGKKLICRLYPNGYPNEFDPYDIKKLHDGCFRLPLNEWRQDTSPFKRPAEFRAYQNLATDFDALFQH